MSNIIWPSVVTALLARVRTAVGSDVQVFDGLPVTYEGLDRYVIVAGDIVGEQGAGQWDSIETTLGMPFRVQESGTVFCSAVAQTGDVDAATTRVACCSLLELINDAIDADPTLGLAATIVSGRVTQGSVTTGQSSAGTSTEIQFAYVYEGTTGT